MTTPPPSAEPGHEASSSLPCVLSFNANDPIGAGGLAADLVTFAAASCHGLAVVTGTYVRDSTEVREHVALDEEVVEDQARCVLEDATVGAFKVGFVGSPDNLSRIAEIASDYPEVPLVAYLADLSWWDELSLETYLDAMAELLLPQTTVLVGNHHALCRWLLPDWEAERPPSARDIARAAAAHGASYVLVTGFHAADSFLENHLASPESVLASARFERFEATFAGAGETLSAALAALLAAGADLQAATAEALAFLDQSLNGGFQPGMGHAVPDRMFWAHDEGEEDEGAAAEAEPAATAPSAAALDFPLDDTRH